MKKLKMSGHIVSCSKNVGLNKAFDRPNITLFGSRCDQPFTALYVWEKFFLKYAATITRFIELGCDNGGMSAYFCLSCMNAEAEYIGFDRRRDAAYSNTPVKRLIGLSEKIHRGNIYAGKRVSHIGSLIKEEGCTVVFADCVDKPWEFRTFMPLIKPGDILAVHDWGRAIKDEWVQDTMDKAQPYKLLFERERLELRTLTRFFLKG